MHLRSGALWEVSDAPQVRSLDLLSNWGGGLQGGSKGFWGPSALRNVLTLSPHRRTADTGFY